MTALNRVWFNVTAYCGKDEFDIWKPSNLHFGLCFQKTYFIVPSSALLAVTSAYYLGKQSEWVVRTKFQAATILIRTLLCALTLCLTLLEPLLVYFYAHGTVYWVDALDVGVQCVSWLVHLGYLGTLKHRLGKGTRGMAAVILSWLTVFVVLINCTRTYWYRSDGPTQLIENITRWCSLTQLILQILYLFTLFPKGHAGRSQYQTLSREPNERTPLIETSYSDYSRFHEAADPYNLGIAEDGINFLSYLTFHWVNGLMEKGSLGLLKTQDDLHDLPLLLRTDVIAHKVSRSILLSQPLPGEDEGGVGGGGDDVEFRGRRPKKFSLLKILHKCFGWQFYSIGLLKLIGDCLGFAGPLLLHQLVSFIEAKDEPVWKGYSYVAGLCAAALCATFCSIHFNYLMSKVNIRVRAALISTVYRKVLTVSSSNLGSFTTGEVVNMMSTDTDRVVNFCSSFHAFWSLPLQMAVTLYLLYNEIGIAFLAGVAIAVILIPINRWLAIKIGKLSVEMMWYKDRRVGLMTEVISMIRMVKLNAWESTFKDRIMDERYGEVKALAGRKYLDAACVYFWATTPVLIPIVTFTTYIALGNNLDPARVFTAIALFNMLIMPLNAFPWVINGLVEAFVSLKRIQKLMELPEQELNSYYTVVEEMNHRDSDLQVLITNGTFSWNANMISQPMEETQQNNEGLRRLSSEGSSISHSLTGIDEEMVLPTLRRIDMQLNKGQVVAIVGRVGSGKSSLINSILAEMEKVHGVIAVAALHRGFGYASQQPWIQNGSIKDNILFGNSLDTQRYRSVLYACALDADLRGFPLRDETPCGENGSSLSGGQKARVALARAVYQNKSIYILDDVLSAVDAPVARHIMRHCVHGLLVGRTILIVSNTLKLLTKVNWLILCDNGVIKEQGPATVVLPKLVDDLSDDWWDEAENIQSPDDLRSQRPPFDVFSTTSVDSHTATPAELESEEREFGSLSSSVFHTCFTAVGAFVSISIFGSMILMQSTRNLTDMWLAYWVSHTTSQNSTGTPVAAPALWFSTSSVIDHASHLNRDPLMDHQGFMAPLKPFAQVLVSQDIPKTGGNLAIIDPQTKLYLIVYSVLAGSNTIFSLFRAFLFAYGGICAARNIHRRLLDAVLYAKITFFDTNPLGRILNRFSSDQYTVDDSLPFQMNIFLSQIFGLLGSVFVTVYGLPWILLLYIPLVFVYYTVQLYYRHTSRDLKRLHALSLSPLYAHFTETLKGLPVIRAMRAVHRFSVRGDSLLEVSQRAQFDIQAASQWLNLRLQLIGLAMLTGVSLLALIQHHFLAIEPGLVGLVISYALTISGYLNNVVGSLTETERELVSIERVNQYLEGAEGEKKEGVGAPPYAWPSHGAIRFQGVHLRYQSHNPYALRNVSFEIGASEKVGIIGRTGAGKSSIFMALFRLLEVSRGRIYIDNIDISKLSLKKLRSNMAIVSQDAFLFSGTIRENLDPRGESLDTQIWQAIHSCYLGSVVQGTGGLDARIEESGRTFSAGQRQLFCLARAMLSRTKIVCIDEGTSRLDNETDEQIQQTIRSAFRNKTVLIIAHRVHTVRDCDRILVLSEGEVVESGRPGELLSNKSSHFYNIVHKQ